MTFQQPTADELRADVALLDRVVGRDPTALGELYDQHHIQRALDSLPAEQRTLILDAFFGGFTHSELADRFSLPLGTVKTRIRSGLQLLRGRLEGRLIER